MKKTKEQNKLRTRREIFSDVLRLGALGGVAVIGVVSRIKPGKGLAGHECVNKGICRGCEVFEGCGLPQALSAKESLKRK